MQGSVRSAQKHSEDLMNGRTSLIPGYQKDSDAQIAQTRHNLDEAGKVLRHLCAQGKLSAEELEVYISELTWAYLMVGVMSYIAQGNKFTILGDRLTSQSFYQKAQFLLMESIHPDQRRMRMIKELSEMVSGARKTMSRDLMPERQF